MCMCVWVNVCVRAFVFNFLCVHLHVHVCMCMHACVSMLTADRTCLLRGQFREFNFLLIPYWSQGSNLSSERGGTLPESHIALHVAAALKIQNNHGMFMW